MSTVNPPAENLGTLGPRTPDAPVDETDARESDPWSAWEAFRRGVTRDLPAHVSSVQRTRRALRRLARR